MIVQNADRIVRARDFEQFGGQLLVTSIFKTLQGEAPFSGWPAMFLRLSGCNFGNKSLDSACRFCDTYFEFDKGTPYTYEALRENLITQPGYSKKDILVVTGGEPTLQHNLIEFMTYVLDDFQSIQIETNGTQGTFFKKFAEQQSFITKEVGSRGLFVVTSPKGVYKAGTIPKPNSETLKATGALKIVIERDTSDTSPHRDVPPWIFDEDVASIPVYLSPMAAYKRPYQGEVSSIWDQSLIDYDQTSANYGYTAELCIKHNFRLSVQSHLFTSIP